MPGEMPDMVPDHWMVYFAVSDVDATLATVTASVGSVVTPRFDVPGVGRMATVQNPAGASFSVMHPKATA